MQIVHQLHDVHAVRDGIVRNEFQLRRLAKPEILPHLAADQMKKNGRVVLLTARPETVLERVRDSDERPLLNNNMNVEFIKKLMENWEYIQGGLLFLDETTDRNDRCLELAQGELKHYINTLSVLQPKASSLIEALRRAPQEEAEHIREIGELLAAHSESIELDKALQEVKAFVLRFKGDEYAVQRMLDYKKQATEALNVFRDSAEKRSLLGLLDYAINRVQ